MGRANTLSHTLLWAFSFKFIFLAIVHLPAWSETSPAPFAELQDADALKAKVQSLKGEITELQKKIGLVENRLEGIQEEISAGMGSGWLIGTWTGATGIGLAMANEARKEIKKEKCKFSMSMLVIIPSVSIVGGSVIGNVPGAMIGATLAEDRVRERKTAALDELKSLKAEVEEKTSNVEAIEEVLRIFAGE